MLLPQLSNGPQSRSMIDSFRGYNANYKCGENEFSEMKNMTGEYYPVMSPRRPRSKVQIVTNPQGIACKDALIYVDGSSLVFNEKRIDMNLSEDEDNCPKQLISMGAYLLIWPDKKYFNTADISDYGDIEAHYTSKATVSFTMCKADGTSYSVKTISDKEPEKPENGDYWIDTSGKIHVLKVWSETSSMWVDIATTYIKINCKGIGELFSEGDGVKISGCVADGTDDLNNTMVIQSKDNDNIIVIGILDKTVTQDDSISVSREIPVLDYVCEANNRIWGCHYGMSDGKSVNEIYASKLGDFRNWNSFSGISTDSYAVSVGSDGKFTGVISYLGYPLFFKENCIHKIYGPMPSSYQIHTTQCRGVQDGSYRSLQIVNEVLYYKSATDVCAYDGSLPVTISSALGEHVYKDAVAGAVGGRYYVSMKDPENTYHMFVYDTNTGMWHHEDNLHALGFAIHSHTLYCIDSDEKAIIQFNTDSDEDYEWMATTGIIGYSSPDYKYISRFNIRIKLNVGTRVRIYSEYDSSGEWKLQGEIVGTGMGTFTLPVIPVRCDHMRIRFEGTGICKIFSIAKILEEGSDL